MERFMNCVSCLKSFSCISGQRSHSIRDITAFWLSAIGFGAVNTNGTLAQTKGLRTLRYVLLGGYRSLNFIGVGNGGFNIKPPSDWGWPCYCRGSRDCVPCHPRRAGLQQRRALCGPGRAEGLQGPRQRVRLRRLAAAAGERGHGAVARDRMGAVAPASSCPQPWGLLPGAAWHGAVRSTAAGPRGW